MKDKEDLFIKLEELVSDMDIPIYRQRSVVWLEKHLSKRNSSHRNFSKAMEIVKYLRKKGIN